MVEKGIVINSSQKRRRSSFEIYVSISSQFNADGWVSCHNFFFAAKMRFMTWLEAKRGERQRKDARKAFLANL